MDYMKRFMAEQEEHAGANPSRTPKLADIGSSVGTSVYSNLRRALIAMIWSLLFVLTATLSAVAVWAETQECNRALWKFVIYNVGPEFYAKKCGCPNSLDFPFSCNSQYLGVGLF